MSAVDQPLRSIAGSRWLALLLAFVLAMLLLSSRPLDEREALTLSCAATNSIAECLEQSSNIGPQQHAVGYSLYSWAWEKLSGDAPWRLRLSNLPWLLAACVALAAVGQRLRVGWLPVVFLAQPFLWSRVNELGPATMQIAAGSVLLWAMTVFVWRRGLGAAWAKWLVLGALLACAASMPGGATLLGFLGVMFAVGYSDRWTPEPSTTRVLVLGVLLLGALGYFTAQNLSGNVTEGDRWRLSPSQLSLGAYDLLGFERLGAERDQLQTVAAEGFPAAAALSKPYQWRLMALAACYGVLALGTLATLVGRRDARRGSEASPEQDATIIAACAAVVLLIGFATLALLCAAMGWSFRSEMLATLLPCWAYVLAWAVGRCSRSALGFALGLAVVGLLLTSTLAPHFWPELWYAGGETERTTDSDT